MISLCNLRFADIKSLLLAVLLNKVYKGMPLWFQGNPLSEQRQATSHFLILSNLCFVTVSIQSVNETIGQSRNIEEKIVDKFLKNKKKRQNLVADAVR